MHYFFIITHLLSQYRQKFICSHSLSKQLKRGEACELSPFSFSLNSSSCSFKANVSTVFSISLHTLSRCAIPLLAVTSKTFVPYLQVYRLQSKRILVCFTPFRYPCKASCSRGEGGEPRGSVELESWSCSSSQNVESKTVVPCLRQNVVSDRFCCCVFNETRHRYVFSSKMI